MVHIFDNITTFEIRVSWTSSTTGYVNGVRFQVSDEIVTFPGHPTFNNDNVTPHTRNLVINLRRAVHLTPEFSNAKREGKSTHLIVTDGVFPGVYSVRNPLNGSVYNAVIHPNKTFCECPDHQNRKAECKHLKAVKRHIEKASEPKLKLRVWSVGKLPSVGKLRAITEDELYRQAKADLGF